MQNNKAKAAIREKPNVSVELKGSAMSRCVLIITSGLAQLFHPLLFKVLIRVALRLVPDAFMPYIYGAHFVFYWTK